MKKTRRHGFTLVEMMVVIAIIGILSAVIIGQIIGRAEKAAADATPAIISQIEQAVEMFKLDNNKYPDTLQDLLVCPSWVDSKKWPPAGYLKRDPVDGWKNPFIYRKPGTERFPFDIVSLGADGKEGGEGYDADIDNHPQRK